MPSAPPSQDRRDVLVVDGMFCAGCAASVEAVLAKATGVRQAAVSFASDAAVVEWSPRETSIDQLVDTVRGLGYGARPVGDAGDRQDEGRRAGRDFSVRLAVAVFFGMWTMLPAFGLYLRAAVDPTVMYGLAVAAGAFSLPVVLYSGWPFYRMGWLTLKAGVPGMDALVMLGVFGAFGLSAGLLLAGSSEVYFEVAVALITLQLIARILDLRVRRRAQDAVGRMLTLAPSTLTVLNDDGSESRRVLKELSVGDRIRIRPGEQIGIDGTVLAGEASVDRSLLTGESAPAPVAPGASVHAGERVLDGALTLELTAGANKRRIDEIARQVRGMLAQKPAWQRLTDKVARHFLVLAALFAVLGAGIALASGEGAVAAAVRALAVFVIACPCALALAAPLVSLVATAAGARRGIILRDLGALTHAAVPAVLFLDKTGTLTRGEPNVAAVHPAPGYDRAGVLTRAALAEQGSEHPLARALRRAGGEPRAEGNTTVAPGQGVTWRDGERHLRVGRASWLADAGALAFPLPETSATRVFVADGDALVGAIDLTDGLREGAREAIAALRARGLAVTVLSGDAPGAVARVAETLGIEGIAALTPEEKVARIEAAQARGAVVAFVGDGLNDGPALAAADLGIAVGDATDSARSAAAVALVNHGVDILPEVLALTRKSRRVIRQNLGWAVIYNALAIPAAMAGLIHPTIAAVAMALSSITVVLNSVRAAR